MKIIYKSDNEGYENIELFNDEGESIANFNTQADSGEDNNLSRMGVLSSIQSILEATTGKKAEVIIKDYGEDK
jgi:hypothetical protein